MTAHPAHAQQAQRFTINVLGVDLEFLAHADPALVEKAKNYIELKYGNLVEKSRGRQTGREQLLIILVMGIADEMLQYQQDRAEMCARINRLLSCIEEMEKDPSF